MKYPFKGIHHKLGKPPGSVIYTGGKKDLPTQLKAWVFDDKKVEPFDLELSALPQTKANQKIWIQVEGIHDTAIIKKIGAHFNIHALFLEDICNVDRPTNITKIESFVGMHLRHFLLEDKTMKSFPLSVLAQDNLIISFSEMGEHGDLLIPIQSRLNDDKNLLRKRSTYYIQYALVDLVVDHYLLNLSHLEDQLETLDESVSEKTEASQLEELHSLRKKILRNIRKTVRSLINGLNTLPETLGKKAWKKLEIYYNDTQDHLRSASESIRNDTERLSSLFDLHFSSLSIQMNQSMQFLAVITVVFLPLTLLTSIYGMNFQKMPGLSGESGFWILLVSMLVIATSTLWYLKCKKWF